MRTLPKTFSALALVLLFTCACTPKLRGTWLTSKTETTATNATSCASGSGIVRYVKSTGSDLNDGSINTPWQTVAAVNAATLNPGDCISFFGGETFSGNLIITQGGTTTDPITLTSYGTGRALISHIGAAPIAISDVGGIKISNINVSGGSPGSPITVSNGLPGDVKLEGFTIQDAELSNGSWAGIEFSSLTGKSGFKDVLIERVKIHDNEYAGINFYAATTGVAGAFTSENVIIRDSEIYSNPGEVAAGYPTGYGLDLANIDGATIERNLIYNNGLLVGTDNQAGIALSESRAVDIQYNEIYGSTTSNGVSVSFGNTNIVVQYNYIHDNNVAVFFSNDVGSLPHNSNVVRFNVAENNFNSLYFYAPTAAGIQNNLIYNNTFYNSGGSSGMIFFQGACTTNVSIINNLFSQSNGIRFVNATAAQTTLTMKYNNYYASAATAVKFRQGASTYATLSAWATATGYETVAATLIGTEVDPLLTAPDTGGTLGDVSQLENLTAYRLDASSPLLQAGSDLLSEFGINPGSVNFFGDPITSPTLSVGAD